MRLDKLMQPRAAIAAILSAAWLLAAAVTLAAPPPPSAFGRLPALSDVDLSPNGKLLVWAEAPQDQLSIVIFDLETRRTLRKIPVGGVLKLRDLTWADDDTVLVTVSQTRQFSDKQQDKWEYWRTQAVDVAGGNARTLLLDGDALRENAKAHQLVRMLLRECSALGERIDAEAENDQRRGEADGNEEIDELVHARLRFGEVLLRLSARVRSKTRAEANMRSFAPFISPSSSR